MSEVSKTIAIEILRESSAALLLNNLPYAGVVPLKTFDYIESGRPILVYGRTGEAAQIVEDLGAGLVVSDGDASALDCALVKLMESPAASWSSITRRLWSEQNNRETVLGDLLRGVDTLVSSGRSGVEHRSS
jgi:glycosyltransferase involved in cell wall biosynthesis